MPIFLLQHCLIEMIVLTHRFLLHSEHQNCFSKILAITSSNSPKTKTLLQENNVETFDTPGIGYVKDLNLALKTISDVVLVTSGDLPLLDKEIIQKIVNQFDSQNIWTSILVTNKFLTTLGIESDYSVNFDNQICHYTGISLVDSKKISSLENLEENYIIRKRSICKDSYFYTTYHKF